MSRERFIKVQDVVLYTADDDTITEGYHIKQYLANNNVEFSHLHYADLNQTHQVIEAINTWIDPLDEEPNLTEFPFLVVREDWEEDDIVVKMDEEGRVVTSENDGVLKVEYELQPQPFEKIYVARSVQEVQDKNLVSKLQQD